MSLKIPFYVSRALVFFICLLATHAVLGQQGKLTFTIDKRYSQDVASYSIIILEENIELSFEANGEANISDLKFGTYHYLLFEHGSEILFKAFEHQQSETVVPLSFESTVSKLSSYTHYGKTEKTKLETQGFAVNVITTERESLQSIQTNELLDRSAGVRIRQSGGIGSNVEYNINGLSGNAIRILIDGVPIRNYGPSFSLNSIPPALIERIEIYKGVIPPHIADDALGGAINIILKKSMRNSLMASYSIGSFNTHQANINGFFRNEKNGFTVNASGFYNYTDNNYAVWGDKVFMTDPSSGRIIRGNRYKRFHDAYQSFGGKADIGFTNVKWADELMLGVLFSDMYNEIQHGATMEIVYGNRFATQSTQMFNLSYKKKDLFVTGLSTNVLATFSYLKRNVVDTIADRFNWDGTILGSWANGGEQSRATLQESDEYNYSVRANLVYEIFTGNSISTSLMYNDFVRKMDDPYLPTAEREFLRDNILKKSFVGVNYENNAFNNKLKTTLFYKYYFQRIATSHTTRSGPGGPGTQYHLANNVTDENGYGIALSYAVLHNLVLMLSGEKAIRFPSNTEVFGNNADNILPNPTLNPEKSWNANMGIYMGPLPLWNEKNMLRINVNTFYRNTTNMIRQGVPSAVNETFAFENLNAVISYGFDVEVQYNYNKKFYLLANTSLFESRFNTEFDQQGNPFFYYGSRLRNAPYFTSNINARYDFRHFIQRESIVSLIYNFGYVHAFLRDWEGIGGANLDFVPKQKVHDIGLTYTFPNRKITLGFDVKNVLDWQVFDNWALQKPGRSFFGKINYRII